MKKNFLSLGIVAILALNFIFSSCSKEESYEVISSGEQTIECQLVDMNTIFSVSRKIESIVDTLQTIEMTRGTVALNSSYFVQMSENQIKQELKPFVTSGKAIQTSLIETINNPEFGAELTTEEIAVLKSLDDVQLAQLSLQFSLVYAPENFVQFSGMQITTDKFIDCLLRASGIEDAKTLIDFLGDLATGGAGSVGYVVSGTITIINAKTAFKLFRGVAVKYLG